MSSYKARHIANFTSKPAFREGWDRIFGKKEVELTLPDGEVVTVDTDDLVTLRAHPALKERGRGESEEASQAAERTEPTEEQTAEPVQADAEKDPA